jgi:hypothetical protein
MGLADHVTLNFSNDMSMAAVFLDIMKAFGTTWHSGLLYNFAELEFSTSLIKLITSFLTDRKFKALVEGKFFMPREVVVGCLKVPSFPQYSTVCIQTMSSWHVEFILLCS